MPEKKSDKLWLISIEFVFYFFFYIFKFASNYFPFKLNKAAAGGNLICIIEYYNADIAK